jgi:leader peptidase (prepilin peptidase)/N-methyltransferase
MIVIAASAVLFGFLLAVALVDARTHRIPDALNAAMAASGLAAAAAIGADLAAHAIGLVLGYAAFAGFAWAYRRVRGREGLGLGDAKFLAAAGAWLGWSGLPFVVLAAASLGLGFIAASAVAGRKMRGEDALPFGPFLACGVGLVWAAQRLL